MIIYIVYNHMIIYIHVVYNHMITDIVSGHTVIYVVSNHMITDIVSDHMTIYDMDHMIIYVTEHMSINIVSIITDGTSWKYVFASHWQNYLPGLNTPSRISTVFYQGDNICDFQMAFLHIKTLLKRGLIQILLKRGLIQKKNLLPPRANSFLLELNPFQKKKINFDRAASPESVLISPQLNVTLSCIVGEDFGMFTNWRNTLSERWPHLVCLLDFDMFVTEETHYLKGDHTLYVC